MTTDTLDTRYGRTPAHRMRARILAILAAVFTALTVGAWVIWVGVLDTSAALETRDIGFVLLSDSEVELRWQLTAPPDAEVSCALKAVSEKHAVVGWRIVELVPAPEVTRVLSATLRTSETAVGALLHRCWLG